MKFSSAHFAMILKYLGISLITGAISHGFFSTNRSLLLALAGIGFFVVGTLLEERKSEISLRQVIYGVGLAIGIGAFAGGLQHFPESAMRSLWVVPVGFVISLVFIKLSQGFTVTQRDWGYIVGATIGVLVLSGGLYYMYHSTSYGGSHTGHSMGSMSMDDMAKMLEGKTGEDIDRAFLEGMIPHHQGAVDMARYLTGAVHTELRKMGEDIIRSQQSEIDQMRKWQIEWGYISASKEKNTSHNMEHHH